MSSSSFCLGNGSGGGDNPPPAAAVGSNSNNGEVAHTNDAGAPSSAAVAVGGIEELEEGPCDLALPSAGKGTASSAARSPFAGGVATDISTASDAGSTPCHQPFGAAYAAGAAATAADGSDRPYQGGTAAAAAALRHFHMPPAAALATPYSVPIDAGLLRRGEAALRGAFNASSATTPAPPTAIPFLPRPSSVGELTQTDTPLRPAAGPAYFSMFPSQPQQQRQTTPKKTEAPLSLGGFPSAPPADFSSSSAGPQPPTATATDAVAGHGLGPLVGGDDITTTTTSANPCALPPAEAIFNPNATNTPITDKPLLTAIAFLVARGLKQLHLQLPSEPLVLVVPDGVDVKTAVRHSQYRRGCFIVEESNTHSFAGLSSPAVATTSASTSSGQQQQQQPSSAARTHIDPNSGIAALETGAAPAASSSPTFTLKHHTVGAVRGPSDSFAAALVTVPCSGFCHNDLRIANVLADRATGNLLLCDFELAELVIDTTRRVVGKGRDAAEGEVREEVTKKTEAEKTELRDAQKKATNPESSNNSNSINTINNSNSKTIRFGEVLLPHDNDAATKRMALGCKIRYDAAAQPGRDPIAKMAQFDKEAKGTESPSTSSSAPLNTSSAPQQNQKRSLTTSKDAFAFAVMLAELVTGKEPLLDKKSYEDTSEVTSAAVIAHLRATVEAERRRAARRSKNSKSSSRSLGGGANNIAGCDNDEEAAATDGAVLPSATARARTYVSPAELLLTTPSPSGGASSEDAPKKPENGGGDFVCEHLERLLTRCLHQNPAERWFVTDDVEFDPLFTTVLGDERVEAAARREKQKRSAEEEAVKSKSCANNTNESSHSPSFFSYSAADLEAIAASTATSPAASNIYDPSYRFVADDPTTNWAALSRAQRLVKAWLNDGLH